MMQQALVKFPFLSLSSVALLIFFIFFVALVIIVNLKSQRPQLERASNLPLEDGEPSKGGL